MKLYELNSGDRFKIIGGLEVPESHDEVDVSAVFTLMNIDGRYSCCTKKGGGYVHPVAWQEVEKV